MSEILNFRTESKQHNAHVDEQAATGDLMRLILVRDRATERERKVIMCGSYCRSCSRYLRLVLWHADSPLNSSLEVPLIDQGAPAAPPI